MNPFVSRPLNIVIHGDCVEVMRGMASTTVDFILTDPPYLVRYCSRDGSTIRNDDNDAWLKPAFAEMYRVLKDDAFCISFYGWNAADKFIAAWREAGFRIVGHIVFRKKYASSSRYLRYCHEQAYLLAKGYPEILEDAPDDVMDWVYTGNRLHPTQKSVDMLKPLISAFCKPGQLVLDPFSGSGSTLKAARSAACDFVGIELDADHVETASRLLYAG